MMEQSYKCFDKGEFYGGNKVIDRTFVPNMVDCKTRCDNNESCRGFSTVNMISNDQQEVSCLLLDATIDKNNKHTLPIQYFQDNGIQQRTCVKKQDNDVYPNIITDESTKNAYKLDYPNVDLMKQFNDKIDIPKDTKGPKVSFNKMKILGILFLSCVFIFALFMLYVYWKNPNSLISRLAN